MKCFNTKCDNEASLILWCPTWASAADGPMPVCENDARTYRPEINPGAAGVSLHWGDEADKAFAQVRVIPRDDERYENAKGMAENGTVICGSCVTQLFSKHIYCVDGRAWLVTCYHATDLGRMEEAKAIFPSLFI